MEEKKSLHSQSSSLASSQVSDWVLENEIKLKVVSSNISRYLNEIAKVIRIRKETLLLQQKQKSAESNFLLTKSEQHEKYSETNLQKKSIDTQIKSNSCFSFSSSSSSSSLLNYNTNRLDHFSLHHQYSVDEEYQCIKFEPPIDENSLKLNFHFSEG